MRQKPLPPELTAPLDMAEALTDLADKLGQFEDGKAFEGLRRERAKNRKPPGGQE